MLSDFISAQPVQAAEAYRWEFTPQGQPALPEYTRNSGNQWIRLQWVSGISLGETYSVRVKVKVNGEWGEYGVSCEITTTSVVPLTELRPQFHNTNSAGLPYVMCDQMIAFSVSGADNYMWRIDPDNDPENGNELLYIRGTGNPGVRLSWIGGLIPANTYQVAVAASVGENWAEFGPVHPVTLGLPASPQLRTAYCNQTYSPNQFILSSSVCSADFYEFELIGEQTSYITSGNYVGNLSNAVPELSPGTYSVRVRVSQEGVVGNWGSECDIVISGGESDIPGEFLPFTAGRQGSATVFPNPSHNEVVILQLDGLDKQLNNIEYVLSDIYGNHVLSGRLDDGGNGGVHLLEGTNSLASGVYLIRIIVNGIPYSNEKLVVN